MVRIKLGSKAVTSPLADMTLVALAALLLSACGSDSPPGSDSSRSTAAASVSEKSRRRPPPRTPPRTPPGPQTNRAPSISGTPSTTAQVGQAWSFTPVASDPEGQPLSFTIANKPGWLSFNTATGALTGTPAATDTTLWVNVTASVSDGVSSASLPPFSITVAAAPPPVPVLGSATLRWVPPATNTDNSTLTDLAGFRVYYGKVANTLDQVLRVTNPTATQQVVDNLLTGTWYFAVTAVSSAGAESAMSALASKTLP